MKLKTKAEAIESIFEAKHTVNGKEYSNFIADIGSDFGKRIRVIRSTRSKCIDAVNRWFAQRDISGDGIAMISPDQLLDMRNAAYILRRNGIGMSLTEIALEAVSRHKSTLIRKTLGDAYKEYVGSFNRDQTSQISIVEGRVGRFVQAIGPSKMCDLVTAQEIVQHVNDVGKNSNKTWNNHATYIKTFFNWCCKKAHQYVPENPISDLEQKQIAYEEPEFLTAEETEKLFRWADCQPERDVYITRLALSFFCGVRQDEIQRISPEDIDVTSGSAIIRKPKGFTRGFAPRPFKLTDTARSWLSTVNIANGLDECSMKWGTYLKKIKIAKRDVGINKCKNAGRHSFITHHVAMYNDPRATEGIVGTSTAMRCSHYMGLVNASEAKAYFDVLPTTSPCETVASLAKTA